jgi:ribonucleoside-diphosphate reductase alpha chain
VHVEEIQNVVEQTLIENNLAEIAKNYILYRKKREEIREEKKRILNKDEIDDIDKKFDLNALKVLAARYLKKDENGKIIESPKELFERVAIHVTLPSILYDPKIFDKNCRAKENKEEKFEPEKYDKKIKIGKYALNKYHLEALKRLYDRLNKNKQMKLSWNEFFKLLEKGEFNKYEEEIESYFNLMVEKKFLPNTPALINFGRVLGMGSACFVLDVDDSIESIMETLKKAAIIFKSGGGVGYNFSKLRPEGDVVRSTSGIASGPISFMTLYDKMTEVIKQGGVRRGANIGILNIDHPDIEKFIVAKRKNIGLRNFNISVFIKPEFWEYYEKNEPYPLVNPRDKKIVKYIDPKHILNLIAYQAWESAEPGVIFGDNANKYNPFFETLGPIQTVNPCGEVLLYPYESCNLGSINVSAFCYRREGKTYFDWDEFKRVILLATRFLDNIIDINKYPIPEIEEKTLKTRKIGLGIMGLADLLFELEIPYNSSKGYKFMERIMEFLNYYSKVASIELAKERGAFPYYEKSFYSKGKLPFKGFEEKEDWNLDWRKIVREIKEHKIRNGFTIVIAPTGSISMIAGCSAGVEPNFALVYEKKVSIGTFHYINPVFEKIMRREKLFSDELIKEICENNGSLQKVNVSEKFKRIFVITTDIDARDHIKALAAITKWTDSSVSKTINLPENAKIEDVKNAILLAHKLGCKDLTIYRYRSIEAVYETKLDLKKEASSYEVVKNKDSCPNCGEKLVREEGCKICKSCGYSVCE